MGSNRTALISISVIIIFCSMAYADSPADLVDMGNKSWVAGDYEDALKKYNEATVDDPESPYIYFNKGTAFYKKGNYSDAVYAFEKAALKSKDPLMESKSRFNLGNCAFREAERQMDSDLKKSLEYCEKSITHFHDALKLDPELNEAAENIEIVRLVMKNILDEINKREQEAKEREKAARENAEKIQEIIKRQEEALKKNRRISESNLKPEELKQNLNQLANEQNDITGDTKDLAEKIKQQSSQQGQGGEVPALKHLSNAIKEQASAEGNLRKPHPDKAENNQEKAIKELKEALKPPEQDQDSQQKQQDQKGQQNKQENEQSQKNESSKQQEKKEQAAVQNAVEDPQDILDEEKENKERRRIMPTGGHREVEKDW